MRQTQLNERLPIRNHACATETAKSGSKKSNKHSNTLENRAFSLKPFSSTMTTTRQMKGSFVRKINFLNRENQLPKFYYYRLKLLKEHKCSSLASISRRDPARMKGSEHLCLQDLFETTSAQLQCTFFLIQNYF